MRNNYPYQGLKETDAAYSVALHALREYRAWRDNSFIGQQLGSARSAYVAILRRRARISLEAYRIMRMSALVTHFREAA